MVCIYGYISYVSTIMIASHIHWPLLSCPPSHSDAHCSLMAPQGVLMRLGSSYHKTPQLSKVVSASAKVFKPFKIETWEEPAVKT